MVQQLLSDSSFDNDTQPYSRQYPDSDGQPISDNTKQFRWIVTIKENLERLFANDKNIFVAGGLSWYPVEAQPNIRQVPSILVAFGRPKVDRRFYKQWIEDDVAPQVVFEVLSSDNRPAEMMRKLDFYQLYEVDEYYIYDPDDNALIGYQRSDESLQVIGEMSGWTSPRLCIRFQVNETSIEIYRPDGEKFLTFVQLGEQLSAERLQRQQDQKRIQALEDKLRELGVNPADLKS